MAKFKELEDVGIAGLAAYKKLKDIGEDQDLIAKVKEAYEGYDKILDELKAAGWIGMLDLVKLIAKYWDLFQKV